MKTCASRYEAATRVLIQRTRDKEKHHVLFQELIDYGFRRNTWGLKIVGLSVLIASLVFSAILCVLKYRFTYNTLATGSFLLLLAGWTFVVTPDWVYRAANTYAERLFDALDEKTELDETVTSKIELA
jgi:hypothetical protein